MIYLETHSTDPYYNLAFEEYVFNKLDPGKKYFLLWQNEKTIVVGKYQNTAEEINQQFVNENNIKVARRLSGGGAVYHDMGNLNFTFIVDNDDIQEFNFKVFVKPIIKVLEKLGVQAEFNGRNDVTIGGEKISGNSQYSKHGRTMHHGCILIDSNLISVADALRVKDAKFESKSVKSVRSRVTTINANLLESITIEQFKEMLKEVVFESNTLEAYNLSKEQLTEIEQLRNEKYATWEWNYGFSPSYKVRKERKFTCGLITAFLEVEAGIIKHIRFFGDFFGNGRLSDLEVAIEGLSMDERLEKTISSLNVNYYINGITAQELSSLILY